VAVVRTTVKNVPESGGVSARFPEKKSFHYHAGCYIPWIAFPTNEKDPQTNHLLTRCNLVNLVCDKTEKADSSNRALQERATKLKRLGIDEALFGLPRR